MRRFIPAALILVTIAGCSSPPVLIPPAPAPTAKPVPVPPPLPPPAPVLGVDWNDWPFSAGDWNYRRDERGSIALFGAPGADAALTLRCDLGRRALYLSVRGPGSAATIRTTTLTRSSPLQPTGGDAGYVASQLAPSDPLLDAIVFSRGRFVVESAGQPPLVVRPFGEIGRVIEDCRG
jgi:hypothetical protein